MTNKIIFTDFDGTITEKDTIVNSIRLFAPEKLIKSHSEKLMKGETTLSRVLRLAFENTDSSYFPAMLDFVDSVPIRPGFDEFLDEMKERNIKVVVLSGGITQFIERKLKPYMNRIYAVHSVYLDTSGDKMKLISPFDDGNELMCKTEVMKNYSFDYSISIGDGATDFKMAKASDQVFARDMLAKYLDDKSLPYIPFDDFFDIKNRI